MKSAIGPRSQPIRKTWIVDIIYVGLLTALTLGFIVWF